jgi:hypothetical protein
VGIKKGVNEWADRKQAYGMSELGENVGIKKDVNVWADRMQAYGMSGQTGREPECVG